jgi:hypothetical protein
MPDHIGAIGIRVAVLSSLTLLATTTAIFCVAVAWLLLTHSAP